VCDTKNIIKIFAERHNYAEVAAMSALYYENIIRMDRNKQLVRTAEFLSQKTYQSTILPTNQCSYAGWFTRWSDNYSVGYTARTWYSITRP